MSSRSHRVIRGSSLISLGTFSTRLLGFAREILAAALFGTGALFDAFVVAFSVPNLFRHVLGEEMFERAFLPRFRRLAAQGKGSQARSFLLRVALLSFACLLAVTVLLYLTIGWVVHLLAPGLDEATLASAVSLSKLILPFLLLIGFAALAGAVLQFSGRQLLFSMAPAVTNLVVIISLVVLHQRLEIRALVVAWLLGAAAALAIQLPAVWRIVAALPPRPAGEPAPALRASLQQGSHVLVSAVVFKAVEVVDRIVASLISSGAISSLYFSFRIVHLPFSMLSLALSRGIAPELSQLRGENNHKGFARLISFGLDINLYVLAPVTVFLMVWAREVVTLFYARGSFDQVSVERTTLAFFFYALAILPMGMIGLVNRVFSSLEDNRIPLVAAAIGGCANVVLDLLLYRTQLAQGGIALASAIGLSLQLSVMLLCLKRFGVDLSWRHAGRTMLRLALALAGFTTIVCVLHELLPRASDSLSCLVSVLIAGILGFTPYACVVIFLVPHRRPARQRVLLTGGGTGGHVYPALAIAAMAQQHDMVSELLYLGVKGKAEEEIVPRADIKLKFIASAPWAGGSVLTKARALATIAHGIMQSLLELVRFRPHLVIATGGYVSAPVIVAATLLKPFLKIKIVVDEQNLVPGTLNKLASLLADVVLVSFYETAFFIWSKCCVHTGYPVREVYRLPPPDPAQLRRRLDIPAEAFVIVVSGGSMGARSINRALAAAVPHLSTIPQCLIIHSTGLMRTPDYNAVEDTKALMTNHLGSRYDPESMVAVTQDGRVVYRGYEYLHDLDQYQRCADMIICRAGAGSLAEVLALGAAAIVIPKRGLPGDHQELNAIGLAEKGAIDVVFERPDLATGVDVVDPQELARALVELAADEPRRRQLSQAAQAQFFQHTQSRVLGALTALSQGEELDLISQTDQPQFVKLHRQFDHLIQHLDTTPPDTLYHRLYSIKVEEYLASSRYLVVNQGIKLVGALRREDLFPELLRRFPRLKGFERRNCLVAFAKARSYHAEFAPLVRSGLHDPYYEVRSATLALYRRFANQLNASSDAAPIHTATLAFLGKRFESFEVKAEAIRACVCFLDEDEFFAKVSRFRWARNVRLREAVLNAVVLGLSRRLFSTPKRVRRFVDPMLVTTSQFLPAFGLRERYVDVRKALEDGR